MFHYKSVGEVLTEAQKQQINLPFSEDASILQEKLTVGG